MAGLPKAELHVHLKGTVEPADMFAFAARNDVRLPWASQRALVAAYDYTGLDAFLTLYWQGCQALCTRADFYDLTLAYLRRAAQNGIVRAEMFFSPQNFLPRGIALADQLGGIGEAIKDADAEWGIRGEVIIVAQRHRSESEALDLLSLLRPHRDRLLGVGLGGPEIGNPPGKFARFFSAARQQGYRLTAHAGEEGPASYVREALDVCRVERIDHGYTATAEPDLVRRFADDGIALTMCPLSNLRLRIVDDLAAYPLPMLLDAGVLVTLNSDDPPYFGGYLNANYEAVGRSLALTREALAQIARNGFTGSFAPAGDIAAGVAAVDAYLEGPQDS
ncbi:MAG: Adenosine deaminase [Pseudonocardiales bacterium]|nr:Adenosine deaminase [Pseudonocardiales bacterium]